MKTLKINISGIVQGVGFRYFCLKQARTFNIKGYAKNLFNGDVEIVAQGNEPDLKDFVKEISVGPRYATVKSVKVDEIEKKVEFDDFYIY